MSRTKVIPVRSIPQERAGRHQDLYEYPCSSLDGLPAHARADATFEIFEQLKKERPWASLVVTVSGPGTWYFNDLRQYFSDCRLPICIRQREKKFSYKDFFEPPDLLRTKPAKPNFIPLVFDEARFTETEFAAFRILRPMARMNTATTAQIASMADYGKTQTGKILKNLVEEKSVEFVAKGTNEEIDRDVWQITPKGVLQALWSWNIPSGAKFKKAREEQKYSGDEHHDISRKFPSWVKRAYGDTFERFQAWTEFPVHGEEIYPDALIWGRYFGFEAIFWCEVETGHKKSHRMISDLLKHFNKAKMIAMQQDVLLVFVALSKSWALREAQELGLFTIPTHTALVTEYLGHEGCLAEPIFGGFNSLTSRYGYKKIPGLYKILKEDSNYFLPKVRSEVLDAICSRTIINSSRISS